MTTRALPLASPESYVVRIYRRDPRLPSRVVGTVEVVADGSERGFKSLRELQQILARGQGASQAAPKPRGVRDELDD